MKHFFGMVTTSASHRYTVPAIESFFAHTPRDQIDRFWLIDNNADFPASVEAWPMVDVIRNPEPRSFARNLNEVLRHAGGADVLFLNNDLIFTPEWLPPVASVERAIVLPTSNQQVQYRQGTFDCKSSLDFEDYLGHEAALLQIAEQHRRHTSGSQRVLIQPYFCVRIPQRVYDAIGLLDESFGIGGGEDVDYSIRARLAGFEVECALGSFVLHFHGKSTWRGGESAAQTEERNRRYIEAFARKWGVDLARLLLVGDPEVVKTYGLDPLLAAGRFKEAIEIVLSRRV